MKVITNRNSNNHFHDNVKYKPIEVQIGDMLREHYDTVEFKAESGVLNYTVDKDTNIFLKLKDMEFSLTCRQENFGSPINKISSTGDIKYNMFCEKEIKSFVESVYALKEEEKKILEIIGNKASKKEIEKIKLAIETFLNKHFKSDIYHFSYGFSPSNLLKRNTLFNYDCIDLVPERELFGTNAGAVQIPVGFDGKIMEIHPYHEQCVFDKCISTTFPDRYRSSEGVFTLEFIKKWTAQMDILEKELKSFDAMKCPEFKDILKTHEECYHLLAKGKPSNKLV